MANGAQSEEALCYYDAEGVGFKHVEKSPSALRAPPPAS
jgi:hypothetical protein